MVAVIFVRGEEWDSTLPLRNQAGLDGHIAFIREHRSRGVVIEAGPFHDPADYVDDHLVGLALLDLASLDVARVLIDTDPVVQTKAFAYRLYEWGGHVLLRR